MSDKISEIMTQVQADGETLKAIKSNLKASYALMDRELKIVKETTETALELSKKNLKRNRQLCYAVREIKHDLATERHRIDKVERDVVRIPETCHRGHALGEHLQAHATNRDEKKIKVSVAAMVPGFIAIIISTILLIKGFL